MQYNNLRFQIIGLLLITGVLLAIPSCRSDRSRQGGREVSLGDFLTEEDIFDDIDRAKKIFYSLPSPLETAMLLKSTGIDYDEMLLNDLSSVERYATSKSKALNLGIYTTDLSFASLFDQAQTSLNYMDATRRLATEMGIDDAIDDETLRRLEENLDNRDVVMDIISETFLNSSSYLKENDQQQVAAIVLVGGWVEGLYIGSQMAGENPPEESRLVDRLAEQKLSFSIVERMLEDNRLDAGGQENRDIAELIDELQVLKAAYDNIEVQTSAVTVEEDEVTPEVASLKSQTIIHVTPEAFRELQSAVRSLRTNFVQ
ncbi:MAG: hypothetical protein JXA61_04670 [Bacteroidales bacterium]|nr:hypothetical protein [Bacteroidales bacterium]